MRRCDRRRPNEASLSHGHCYTLGGLRGGQLGAERSCWTLSFAGEIGVPRYQTRPSPPDPSRHHPALARTCGSLGMRLWSRVRVRRRAQARGCPGVRPEPERSDKEGRRAALYRGRRVMYLGRGVRVPPTMHARRCCGRSVGRRVCRTDGNGFPVSNSRVVEFTRLSRLGNVCGPAGGHDNGGTARRNRADGCRAGVLEPLGHPAIGGLMNCTPLCWPGSRRTIAQRVRMRRGTAVSWRALMVALLALAVSATASAAAVLAPVVSRHGCVSDGTFGCARVRGVLRSRGGRRGD